MGTLNLSLEGIPEHVKETSSEIHVSNRVDGLVEMDASGLLSIPCTPHVFNSFHMPLIHNDNNSFVL